MRLEDMIIEMAFETQRQVQDHFAAQEKSDENDFIKQGLFDLISNVIIIRKRRFRRRSISFQDFNGADCFIQVSG
jgi:hypothetical protein